MTLVLLLAGCSAEAKMPTRLSGPAGTGSTGIDRVEGGTGSGPNRTDDLENPSGLIPMVSGVAGSAGIGGDMGMAGNLASNGCEVGKFCGPMSPDPTDCGTLTLKQDVEVKHIPGNLLLVFDQSASMGEPWGTTGQNKLQAAQSAIMNAVTSLKDSLTVGALFFPTFACVPAFPPPPGGAVAPLEGDGQIPFQSGPMFLQSWANHWTMPGIGLGIGTPMQEAFDRADVAIQNSTLKGALAVVAVTDGAPNCLPDPMVTMIPTALETEHAANWLANKQIKTYVVGLPGAAGVDILNNVAVSGGTMQYIVPDDPKMLEDKLKEVVQETVKTSFDSCSIKLTPVADPADKLKMIVVESQGGMKSMVPRMLSADAGWSISSDGGQVEIMGQLCDDAKGGRFSEITFEYGCKDLPPLPPPPPLN
jgi:hypothetical protein